MHGINRNRSLADHHDELHIGRRRRQNKLVPYLRKRVVAVVVWRMIALRRRIPLYTLRTASRLSRPRKPKESIHILTSFMFPWVYLIFSRITRPWRLENS